MRQLAIYTGVGIVLACYALIPVVLIIETVKAVQSRV